MSQPAGFTSHKLGGMLPLLPVKTAVTYTVTRTDKLTYLLWMHAQRASMLYFADVFLNIFFIPALVGQTAERIFTKLSHVVDIRHHLRTY